MLLTCTNLYVVVISVAYLQDIIKYYKWTPMSPSVVGIPSYSKLYTIKNIIAKCEADFLAATCQLLSNAAHDSRHKLKKLTRTFMELQTNALFDLCLFY